MIVGYAAAFPPAWCPTKSWRSLPICPVAIAARGLLRLVVRCGADRPFLIAALANTLKAAALLTAAEKFADADWVRPDLKRIGGGVLADGITTSLSGALCVFGVNVSASSVGLSEATGVASRVVAYAISGIFVVMAFIPGLMRFFTLMPAAVVGATFIFTSCAIIKGGIETIASRMLDTRRTLVVGLAILTGLAVEAFPASSTRCRPRSSRWSARRWCGHVRGVRPERRIPHRHAPPRGAAHRSTRNRLRRDPQLHGGAWRHVGCAP